MNPALDLRRCELEALDSADTVVRGYRPATDGWDFSFDSPFWHAIRHAHALGHRGAGKPGAIIDSGCDMELPRLRARVQRVKSYVPPRAGDKNAHGTAVALLIAEVAPQSALHVYNVVRDGVVDPYAVLAALRDAAASEAQVINLSLASPFSYDVERTALRLLEAFQKGEDTDRVLRGATAEEPSCALCRTAQSAAASGKMVFAAVGNSLREVYCPSRADEVFAVGFQSFHRERTRLENGGFTETAVGLPPSGPQSALVGLTIEEIPGVLGSSFACPLHAGAAALGVTFAELKAYARAAKPAAEAQLFHAALKPGNAGTKVRRTHELYQSAFNELPHVHDEVHAQLRPNVPISDPAQCATCGIYAESTMTNFGLFLLQNSRTNAGRVVLETACTIAPWSAHAAANLGAAYRELGDRVSAVEQYERALKLRPGNEIYQHELNVLSR